MASTYTHPTSPPILRIHSDIAGMIADELDMPSLSCWRATCLASYREGSSSLRRTLIHRLWPFAPFPQELVDVVTQHGTVFGGELALSFILRHEPYEASFLEIYASNFQYSRLCNVILHLPCIGDHIKTQGSVTYPPFHALRRLVTGSLIVHLANGNTIYVHQSYTCSPCAPISRSPCTALSNFVTGYGFGCSHPGLTLQRRALLADRELLFISPHDAQSLDRLLIHKFSFAVSPTAWPEYQRDVEDNQLLSAEECWRDMFICPNQGRFFGDRGSLVGFFDPLAGDEERCVEMNMAPFGPMVIWRVMSTFECDDGCQYLDEVLEQGVTSVPVFFRKDPFGELRDCISDLSARGSLFYRRFHRRRSMSI